MHKKIQRIFDGRDLLRRAYGPAPFWAWTGRLTPQKIDRDLQRFCKMEVYEIVIMPLYGLRPPYLEKEYLALYAHTCRRCRQWGMKIWIYDEFNWPSGTCAGKVLKKYPQARQKIIAFDWPTDRRKKTPSWKIEDYSVYDLAAYGSSWSLNTTGYLDTLDAQAVKYYLVLTHEAYRRALEKYFGDVIVGFYTDEPVTTRGLRALPFTPALFDLFRQRYGYALEQHVPALAVETPEAPRVRRDYWALVTELFQKNFFRQYAGWCARHGLKMTGHLLYEETFTGQIHFNGDMFDVLSVMQVPGIDMLEGITSFDRRGLRARWGGEAGVDVAGKLIESVGFFSGKKRLMCEAYGVTPHTCTARFYKRATDYLLHHGISMMNDNLFSDAQGSFRAGFGCHSFWTPWVHHYRQLSRYVRALSWLNAGSTLTTETAILLPRTDLWRRYRLLANDLIDRYDQAEWQTSQQIFIALTHGLIRRHRNFYFLFEQLLTGACAAKGGLQIGGFACRVIVLPDVHVLPLEVSEALQTHLDVGGYVVCVSRVPAIVGRDNRPFAPAWAKNRRVIHVAGSLVDLPDKVAIALDEIAPPAVTISGRHIDQVMLTQRRARGGEWLFLTNFGEQSAEIKLHSRYAWQSVDNPSGRDLPCPPHFLLRPDQSLLLKRLPLQGRSSPVKRVDEISFALPSIWRFRLPEGNTLSLPVRIYQGAMRKKQPELDDKYWTPACTATAPFDLVPGRAYWLRADFEVVENLAELQLVVDGYDQCMVFFNGRRLRGKQGRYLWDDENVVFDLACVTKPGKHTVLIRYTPCSDRQYITRFWPLTFLPPFVLRGQFTVKPRLYREKRIVLKKVPATMPIGNLLELGMPNLVGVAEYSAEIEMSAKQADVILDLGDQQDAFDVIINGRAVGTLLWPPYRLAVSRWLKRGRNEIKLRLHTAMGGILCCGYRGKIEERQPPIGLLEVPSLMAAAAAG